MLHLKHWKTEDHPCAKERKLLQRAQRRNAARANLDSCPHRITSASNEDQCLTGELYLFPDNLHDPFPDTWKQAPSDTKAA